MRKLKLDLDSLDVQTFAAGEIAGEPGTVRAHSGPTCADSCDGVCGTYFCPDYTFQQSCVDYCDTQVNVTCDPSCGYTCWC